MKLGLSPRARGAGACGLLLILLPAGLAATTRAQAQTATVPAAAKKPIEKKSKAAKTCYAVQTGAYENRAEAEAMMESLAREFSNAIQMSQTIDGGRTRWRVRILATTGKEARAIAARLLSRRGTKAWVDAIPCPDL